MAGLYQLRTYTLKSAEAARAYAPYWPARHKASLEAYGVKMSGVFLTRSAPHKVIAVVQFPPGKDPQTTMKEYTGSEQFKKDLEGFDKSQFESVESVDLEAAEISPAS